MVQAAVTASRAAQVCVPCLVYICVAMAAFAVLILGSLYHGGDVLQSAWAVGRQRGQGLREVALQGFKCVGVSEKDAQDMQSRGGAGSEGDLERETQRLIGHEREP